MSVNNSGTTRQGRYTKILSDLGIKLKDNTVVHSGATDPSVTALDAPKGSIYLSSSTGNIYQKADSGSTTNWHPIDTSGYTKDATGFIDNDLIAVGYDTGTTNVILTNVSSGKIEFLMRNRYFSYPSPWTVPTVIGGATPIPNNALAVNGIYFLKIDPVTLVISFDLSPWTFSQLQICAVVKNATAHFGMREIHGLMPYLSHESDHYTKGTYIRTAAVMTAGTAFTALTSSVATTASNCPGIDAHTIYDEDIPSVVNAWPEASYTVDTYNSGAYTTAYRNGAAGVLTFDTTAQLPYLIAGGGVGVIQYNPITAGVGALANVTEDNYVNYLAVSIPVTSSTESQKFRTIFFAGQRIHTTLAAALLEAPSQWDFGEWTNLAPERVAIQMYTYQYNAAGGTATPATVRGRAFLAATPTLFTGARNTSFSVSGVSPSDHQTLSNRSATGTHPISAIAPTTANRYIISDSSAVGLTESVTASTYGYKVASHDRNGIPRIDGTDAHILALGTTLERPGQSGGTDAVGMLRYNSDVQVIEAYHTAWEMLGFRTKIGALSVLPAAATTIYTPSTSTGVNTISYEAIVTVTNGTDSMIMKIVGSTNVARNAWVATCTVISGVDLLVTIDIVAATGVITCVLPAGSAAGTYASKVKETWL